MKVRLKIERTSEYQHQLVAKRNFGEKDRLRLISQVVREQHEFVRFELVAGYVPAIRTTDYVLFPLFLYEFVETGECCEIAWANQPNPPVPDQAATV